MVRLLPCWLLLLLSLGLVTQAVSAHEVRPAYLEITEHTDGSINARWRQPIMGDYTLAISPVLSSGWLDGDPQRVYTTDTSLIKTWTVTAPKQSLAGQTLWIRGLDRTITDTLVRIEFANGREVSQLLRATQPRMLIPANNHTAMALPQYLQLGIRHIWSGADHLLYILGLILLIGSLRALVTTISAFTLAHSITLACSALGLVHLQPAPVEAVIALSIVYVAVEVIRLRRGQASLAGRAPWLIAMVFGLLHGFGFASALRQIGLPENSMLGALFLFNVGIEIGQLLFLVMVVGTLAVLKNNLPRAQAQLISIAPYCIGSMASFWLVQRLVVILH